MYSADIETNAGHANIEVRLVTDKDLHLTIGPISHFKAATTVLELEQLRSLILSLQAAEVQMTTWKR